MLLAKANSLYVENLLGNKCDSDSETVKSSHQAVGGALV